MPRLFAALLLPPEICESLDRVRQPTPGARWVDLADLHLTLRFVGDIGHAQARDFTAELAAIQLNAFSLALQGLGEFGGDEPRAIWAGVAPSAPLDMLARATERAARNAGLPPENRTFKPHVTLARLRHTPPDAVARVLSRKGTFKTAPFFVGGFALMSGKPVTGGGPYVVEETFTLIGGDYATLYDDGY